MGVARTASLLAASLLVAGAGLPVGQAVAAAAVTTTGATAVTAATTATPILRTGSAGPAVADWQRQLNAVSGAGLAVDGIFGPRTDHATRNFQASRHIVVDGIVGPQTRAAMAQAPGGGGRIPSSVTWLLRTGSTGPAVADWQRQLNAASGAGLAVDGIFGPRTDHVTRNFQASHHIVVDGIVGPQTRAAMAQAMFTPPPARPTTARPSPHPATPHVASIGWVRDVVPGPSGFLLRYDPAEGSRPYTEGEGIEYIDTSLATVDLPLSPSAQLLLLGGGGANPYGSVPLSEFAAHVKSGTSVYGNIYQLSFDKTSHVTRVQEVYRP
jgi:peptidoglycan hydrolase-like protein with peptidoglycan-binding domain